MGVTSIFDMVSNFILEKLNITDSEKYDKLDFLFKAILCDTLIVLICMVAGYYTHSIFETLVVIVIILIIGALTKRRHAGSFESCLILSVVGIISISNLARLAQSHITAAFAFVFAAIISLIFVER